MIVALSDFSRCFQKELGSSLERLHLIPLKSGILGKCGLPVMLLQFVSGYFQKQVITALESLLALMPGSIGYPKNSPASEPMLPGISTRCRDSFVLHERPWNVGLICR